MTDNLKLNSGQNKIPVLDMFECYGKLATKTVSLIPRIYDIFCVLPTTVGERL